MLKNALNRSFALVLPRKGPVFRIPPQCVCREPVARPGDPGKSATATERLRILSVCDDEGLLFSRQLLFENHGYLTESAMSSSLLGMRLVRSVDCAVICHSIEAEQAVRLAERLRRYNSRIRILRIQFAACRDDFRFDLTCDSLAGPQALLTTIDRMLGSARTDKAYPRMTSG